MNGKNTDPAEYESTIGMQTFLLMLIYMAVGTLAAVVILPIWMPRLSGSLLGSDPKAYWYLSRGSSFVAMTLLWVSMALGLGITNKMARIWPGAPAAFAIHEYVSLLGLCFAIFHALILMGDHYINFTLVQIVTPFATTAYKPLWVGLGQVGFYVWLLVALSFYVRSKIGPKVWRLLHYISFLCYCVALYHGISSGTDTKELWAQAYYWISGGILVFLLIQRIVVSITTKLSKRAAQRTMSIGASSEAAPSAQ
jgi:predicted ferric reductase